MDNGTIADNIKLFAQLSEIHGRNPFKIKSYMAASFRIDKMPQPLAGLSESELIAVDGIGQSLASKIHEIATTGSFIELDNLIADTPPGVADMLKIKGIGPKKIGIIWKQMGIDTVGELLYACNENRLVEVKGFGYKTQETIKKSIEFAMSNAHKFHYARVERLAFSLLDTLSSWPPVVKASTTGAFRRKCEVLEELELLIATQETASVIDQLNQYQDLQASQSSNELWEGVIADSLPLKVHFASPDNYASKLFETTCNAGHLQELDIDWSGSFEDESDIYSKAGLAYIEPELREGLGEIAKAKAGALPELVELTHLKGILHNHSTYSDGLNTLEEMATYCKELGYEYLGICDHSQTAVYANGLKPDRVAAQQEEIRSLNQKLAPFRIFSGIESDILNDGSLDYAPEVLQSFDFIVASVHANLKMDEEKANARLLKAIENPYTTILGHPTGRLLLMREGYPIDHRKIIDACAANNVVIEINANPYRLDLDWRWIDYALSKDVMLSINPDAHRTDGYHDMHYGVCVARKGGLTPQMTFNALSLEEITAYFDQRKASIGSVSN